MTVVPFKAQSEDWTVYHLQDGTEVKVRVILVEASRRDGEFHPDGSPVYDFNMQHIVHVRCPEGLRVNQHQTSGAVQ
jgi:hypothetical protein